MYIKLLISFIFISSFYAQTAHILPVYKIILAENINNIYSNANEVFNMFINRKGIGIKFNNNSDYNIMPMQLFETIKNFYRDIYNNLYYFETLYKDEYIQLIISDYCDKLEILHFILEDRGILVPIEELFTFNKENNKFTFAFLGKEDEDYIIFGKELIKLMELKFEGNNLIINNQQFLLEDENF